MKQVFADKILEFRLDAEFPQSADSDDESSRPSVGGLSEDIVRGIDSLWHDPIIPSVLDRSSEFYLMDSAA